MDDVVIVGAGPAGLAAAATLRARGIDTTIIERGRVGEPWRSRYDRLHLHTIRSLSHLPGYRIPREFGRWVARDQFVQYLEQYAAHHRLEPRFEELRPRVLTAITATGASARLLARFPRGWSWWPLDIPAFHICPMAWHIRWAGGSFGGIPQSAAVSRPGRAHCWCRQQRHRDCRRSCRGGARRVRIAIRTPPNILRRDVKGFPIQLLGIVFRRLPTRLLDPLILVLRRATIPDLSAFGLPRRSAPFSQFRRTGTVPIFDVGFIDAVRSGVIEVVPGVTRPRWPGGGAGRWITRFSGRRGGGHRLPAWARAARRPSHSDRRTRYSRPASQSQGYCTKLAWMPDTLQETWRANLAP